MEFCGFTDFNVRDCLNASTISVSPRQLKELIRKVFIRSYVCQEPAPLDTITRYDVMNELHRLVTPMFKVPNTVPQSYMEIPFWRLHGVYRRTGSCLVNYETHRDQASVAEALAALLLVEYITGHDIAKEWSTLLLNPPKECEYALRTNACDSGLYVTGLPNDILGIVRQYATPRYPDGFERLMRHPKISNDERNGYLLLSALAFQEFLRDQLVDSVILREVRKVDMNTAKSVVFRNTVLERIFEEALETAARHTADYNHSLITQLIMTGITETLPDVTDDTNWEHRVDVMYDRGASEAPHSPW